MYIEKLNISTFGRLNSFELELSPGMNIVEGANESGKSTIAAFIKFMFYGFNQRERASLVSWDTAGAAGTLTFKTEAGHRYRIERALMTSGKDGKTSFRETVQLVDLSNNMPCHKGESPGELFFGVDAEMFASTAFVSQLGTKVSGERVSEGIENLLFSADETVNTQRALAKLDEARVLLLHKNSKGGRLWELSNEVAGLEERLDRALKTSAEIQSKEAKLADLRKNEAAAREKSEKLQKKLAQFEARTILGLFGRMNALEAKSAELKRRLEESGMPDPGLPGRIRAASVKLEQLRSQLDSMPESSPEPPPLEPELANYLEAGGCEGIESRRADLKSSARSRTAVGIILSAAAVIALAASLIPMLLRREPTLWGLIAGAAMLALAVVLFVGGAKERRELADLDEEFDVDALEAKLNERNAANEAAKLAGLARADTQSRLDEALSEAAREFKLTGDVDAGLEKLLAETEEREKAVESLRAEYEKCSGLLAGMREQLAGYDESEVRGRLDDSIDTSDIDAANLTAMRREAEFTAKSAASLERFSTQLERELAGLYPTAEDAAKLNDRLNAAKLEQKKLDAKLKALQLAGEMLTKASGKLRESVAPRLASEAGELLCEATGGKYREVGVGGGLELTCAASGGQRSVGCLSAGTQDAAYLALRMALCGLVYRREAPPMVYDESFARMDDARCAAMLRIAGARGQSLILTVSDREARLAGAHTHTKI